MEFASEAIQGALSLLKGQCWDGLKVDHGSFDISVTEEALDGLEIVVGHQEVTCEGVPEGVRRDTLGDVCALDNIQVKSRTILLYKQGKMA